MDGPAWIVALVAIVMLIVLVGVIVAFRGSGGGGFQFGPLKMFASGRANPVADVDRVESEAGGITARGSGGARVRRSRAKGDVRAEAGTHPGPKA